MYRRNSRKLENAGAPGPSRVPQRGPALPSIGQSVKRPAAVDDFDDSFDEELAAMTIKSLSQVSVEVLFFFLKRFFSFRHRL